MFLKTVSSYGYLIMLIKHYHEISIAKVNLIYATELQTLLSNESNKTQIFSEQINLTNLLLVGKVSL